MFDLNIKVLVVDDMLTMRKIVSKTCQTIGFKDIQEASDGAKAWEIISSAKPAIGLIISDWNMPNCTGIELLKRVRGDSRFKNTPFLLVTAETEKTQIIEALQAGVSGYVIKPFTKESLEKQLGEAHKKMLAG